MMTINRRLGFSSPSSGMCPRPAPRPPLTGSGTVLVVECVR